MQRETVGLATGGEHGGRRKIDGSRSDPSISRATLSEAGIDKHLADRARKYAAIPQKQFDGSSRRVRSVDSGYRHRSAGAAGASA
jgi:hypothetical protein